MNELLQMVMQFNTAHQDENIFAHFSFAGHTQGVEVRVERTGIERYRNIDEVEHLYGEYCYLNAEHGQRKNIESLTEHFRQWVTEFEREKAA